jgi:IS30 family transposase
MSQQLTESDRAVLTQLLALKLSKKEIAARQNKPALPCFAKMNRNSGRSATWPSKPSNGQRYDDRCRGGPPNRATRGPRISLSAVGAVLVARSYCSWQRGTNEHTNGLVRQYLAKGTDLTAYSHLKMAAIQSSLNDRPRKRLGYLTPHEVSPKTPPAAVSQLEFETAQY